MRAAIIEDGSPEKLTIGDVAEPGGSPATVLAAALNPVDLAIAKGMLPFRQLAPDAVLGFEGVARTDSEEVVYFSAPVSPGGSYAERVDLTGAETAPVPEGLDPVQAAAIGVPGIAAWLALMQAGGFRGGERVLVLGATGSVGRIATQIALASDADVVVGTARNDEGTNALKDLGAYAVRSDGDLSEALANFADEGFDVVVDTLWGDPAKAAIDHMRTGGRLAQVGNSAAAAEEIVAPAFRNRRVSLVGHSNFLASEDDRYQAYIQVADLVVGGAVQVDPTTITLDELPSAWSDLAAGRSRGKVVVTPST